MSLWSRILNFLYHEDQAVASLAGAPKQETISSEIGRNMANPIVHAAGTLLDDIRQSHVENAVKHADALEKAEATYQSEKRGSVNP